MDPVLLGEILAGLMFFGIIGFLMLGFPVAFTLAGVSLMFGLVGMSFGVFDPSNFGALANRYLGFMTNEVLVAVPLASTVPGAAASDDSFDVGVVVKATVAVWVSVTAPVVSCTVAVYVTD